MTRRAIVIGAGADELVAAHRLARSGFEVLVIDRRPAHDRATLQTGWVPERLVRELRLAEHGLQVQQPDPWIAVALPQGGRLELWRDMRRSVEALRKLSERDAARWPEFCARAARAAGLLAELYGAPAPDPLAGGLHGLTQLARTGLKVRRLGREGLEDLMRWLPMPVADLLDEWFENDALKAALGTAGIAHLAQGPRSGGTAFALLHHHAGSAAGVFRPAQSNIELVLEKAAGAKIRAGAEVASIAVGNGRVEGVALSTGEALGADVIVSGADPQRTLLQWVDAAWLDPEFTRAARNIRRRGVVARVTLSLERPLELPPFLVAPSLDYVERAYEDAKHGKLSREPYLEARAEGTARLVVHVQYAPYRLAEGEWSAARRQALGERVVELLSARLPQLNGAVADIAVRTPRDLEQAEHWPEGQAYHAELALDQMLWMRPVPGWSRYRMPLEGLYLCGPGTHPGGVPGMSGELCARQILRDAARRPT